MGEQHFVVKAAGNLMRSMGLDKPEETPLIERDEPLLKSATASAGTKPGHKYIKRKGTPGNYTYWYKDANGRLVAGDAPEEKDKADKANLEEVKQKYGLNDEDVEHRRKLGVPLNVGNVVIHSGHPKLVAEWTDNKGRSQKLYKPEYVEQASKAKFKRMLDLKNHMPEIRETLENDMNTSGLNKNKVISTVVKLIDSCYFRVGNEKYADENGTYGVSTLLKDHMSVEEAGVSFDYVGKKSVDQHKFIADHKATEILIDLQHKTPGDRLFQYEDKGGEYKPITSRDVNDYLDRWGVTAKDFRTYHASRLCATYLADLGVPADEKAIKQNVSKAIQQTAADLGHTPEVCRKNYISGEILKAYERGEIMEDYVEKSNANHDSDGRFSKNEQSFNKLLDRINQQSAQDDKKQDKKNPTKKPVK